VNQPGRRSRRWGVILAGGDGDAPRNLTRSIAGDDRPKQFCHLLGKTTLLEEARRRAQRSIPAEQIVVALNRNHQEYFSWDRKDAPGYRMVQPCDRGTAPPIVYSLLHIGQIEYDATIAIFPSDHYYSDENLITSAIESAFEIARIRPRSVVLLGVEPNVPEVDYGWLEIGSPAHQGVFQVRALHEKPPVPLAERLLQSGALWNTCVMVGHISAFLQLVGQSLPGLIEIFAIKMSASHLQGETHLPDSVYDLFGTSDFSRQVLSPGANQLLALLVDSLEWNDLGNPQRVLSALLARTAALPSWAESWQAGSVA
jgi:mannose-1-phosphate guanylyltransferase